MVPIGRLVKPGHPAPARGTYLCTDSGCTGSFVASMKGTPLPPSHHPGALWRLTEVAPAGALPRERRRVPDPPSSPPDAPPAAKP
jgi:hypothetical protein